MLLPASTAPPNERISMRFPRKLAALSAVLGAVALAPAAAQAYSTPTESCHFTPAKTCVNDGGAPLARAKSEDVGSGKHLTTNATLYRNGLLMVDSFGQNSNWVGGLRPRTMVVAVDDQGRAIWVSNIFASQTLCAVPDFSCASSRRETFSQQLPDAVGHYAADLQIYDGDAANYVDLRNRIIDGIKATGDIAAEIKAVLGQLLK
jgi:hypothetical protein